MATLTNLSKEHSMVDALWTIIRSLSTEMQKELAQRISSTLDRPAIERGAMGKTASSIVESFHLQGVHNAVPATEMGKGAVAIGKYQG